MSWLADRIEHWPLDKLLPYVRNARQHSEDQIAQIAEDARGALWLGCLRGVFRVSKGELHAVASGRASRVRPLTFDSFDGMKSAECSSGQVRTEGWKSALSMVATVAIWPNLPAPNAPHECHAAFPREPRPARIQIPSLESRPRVRRCRMGFLL